MKKLLLCASFLALYATSAEAAIQIVNKTTVDATVFISYAKGGGTIKSLNPGKSATFSYPPGRMHATMHPHGQYISVDCTIPQEVEGKTFTIAEDVTKEPAFTCSAPQSAQQKRGKK